MPGEYLKNALQSAEAGPAISIGFSHLFSKSSDRPAAVCRSMSPEKAAAVAARIRPVQF
jgi:hypothetical protein